jgi:hypothetical protein
MTHAPHPAPQFMVFRKLRIVLIATLLLSVSKAWSQDGYTDIVILRDRTEVICRILEETSDGVVRIRKTDGSVISYSGDLIYDIEKNGKKK